MFTVMVFGCYRYTRVVLVTCVCAYLRDMIKILQILRSHVTAGPRRRRPSRAVIAERAGDEILYIVLYTAVKW